jgi:hypothetical protein
MTPMNQERIRIAGELGCFVQRYARNAHAGHDSNDRRHDQKVEKAMRRPCPEELSELLSDVPGEAERRGPWTVILRGD